MPSIALFMAPGVVASGLNQIVAVILPPEDQEDVQRNLAICAGIILFCMTFLMIILGKNRSELQKKLSLYDDEKVNFLLYNPITFCCCLTCLTCQVRTSLDLITTGCDCLLRA